MEPHAPGRRERRTFYPLSTLDRILTAQIIVGWAGEEGEEPRLEWWQSDLVLEDGGATLFQELLPETWRWALLQGVREAARREDARRRTNAQDPDQLLSLFSLGFELDERLDERLQDLKRSGQSPVDALPGLKEFPALTEILQVEPEDPAEWEREAFIAWIEGHGEIKHITEPSGRRITKRPPESPEARVDALIAALLPLSEKYPLPHYRRGA